VYFRAATREAAQRAGVAGWVRNLPDDRVEAVFEGPPAAVQRLIDWCRQGPPAAVVEGMRIEYEPPEGLTHFEVLRS
jgi:acylphosphatase